MSGLGRLLEREIDLISRFTSHLQQEQVALKSATPEALPEIHREKELLVNQLNAIASERDTLVKAAAGSSGKDGMRAWLNAHPRESIIAAQWQQLLTLALNAKHLNELNAKLIRLHLDKTAQALAILNRQPEKNTLYGSNGQASQLTGSRIVDSA